MKGLNQFNVFDISGFLSGKHLTVTAVSPLLDFDTKKEIGTKVDTAITQDNTTYTFKQGEAFTNLYEKLPLKVIGKKVDVSIGAIIEPVQPTGAIYGDFRSNLSVRCSDIKVVSAPAAPKG